MRMTGGCSPRAKRSGRPCAGTDPWNKVDGAGAVRADVLRCVSSPVVYKHRSDSDSVQINVGETQTRRRLTLTRLPIRRV